MKKIIAFILCAILIFTVSVPVFAENSELEISVNDEVYMNELLRVVLNAENTAGIVSGEIEISAFFNLVSGAEYDMENYKYTFSFNAQDGPYEIVLEPIYKTDTFVSLKNITIDGNREPDFYKDVKIRPIYTPVYTKEDLNNIRNNMSGDYILMNDIIFTEEDFAEDGAFYNGGYGWIPIGTLSTNAFTGSFYGNGKTIEGLRINKAYYLYNGVFGVNKGEIEDLYLKNIKVDVRNGINTQVLLETAGETKSETIEDSLNSRQASDDFENPNSWTDPNATVTDEVFNKYDRSGASNASAGTLCGINYGTVRECYIVGDILGNNYAGGVCCENKGTVRECAVEVDISGVVLTGGVSAKAGVLSKIYDCAVLGSSDGGKKGAFLGEGNGEIIRCYSTINAEKVAFSGTVKGEEAYITDKSLAGDITFTNGDWNYSLDLPYPATVISFMKTATAVKGDVNGNGEAEINDLALLKLYLVGAIDKTDENIVEPDVDGNEVVEINDLAMLKLILAGAY
ncbi:MAG: hypothetical protein E7568_01830 [Ruminococcaceae bacterium]|nr:hypothetical protein [Oscillospiraceae bacterium]